MPVEDRLDPSDARFIDVIHSDVGYSLLEGMRTRVGQLDFYPNDGNNQPDCKHSPFSIFPRIGLFNGLRYYLTCDHYRAVEYYIESIQLVTLSNSSRDIPCQHEAVACGDWNSFSAGGCANCSLTGCAFMGYYSDFFSLPQMSSREYFVQTFDEEPFRTFQYQVSVETESEQNVTSVSSGQERSGINRGIIRLELEELSGRKTRLDDKKSKEMKPGDNYVYLATSRFHINAIQRANFWFVTLMNANTTMLRISTNLKRIKVMPIALTIMYSGASPISEIVMCGSFDKAIEGNKKINLTINDC